MLIQGYSLSTNRDDVAGIVEACDQGDVGEAREAAPLRQPGGGGVRPPERGAAPDRRATVIISADGSTASTS
ncbi:hypothetical protein ABZ646_40555 [Streptomyces sp. NPDC007162]|uniref:DUF6959 family protein n=1 Tax=Streptomyces sp. NPDC007162 TaxID=3156917 RepID=UPI0033C8C5FA